MSDPVEDLLREAGRLALDAWQQTPQSVRDKAAPGRAADFVSAADLAVDCCVADGLQRLHPAVALISEERGPATEIPADAFVLDPIDGTHNFLAGNPWWTISLARTRGHEVEEAWIHHPVTGAMTHAVRGGSTTLDGERVRVSDRPCREGLVSIAMSWDLLPLIQGADQFAGLRALGSQAMALAMTAAGRFLLHAGRGRPWDVAAGFLLVERAGGVVRDTSGQPLSPFEPRFALVGPAHAVDEALAIFGVR